MNAQASSRLDRRIQLLLAAPLFLWLLVLLHVLRFSVAFNFLAKHLGPVVVFGTMTLCPLIAAFLGWRMRGQNVPSRWARVAIF